MPHQYEDSPVRHLPHSGTSLNKEERPVAADSVGTARISGAPDSASEDDKCSRSDAELMQKYGISFDGCVYHFRNYQYDRLEDAINYAQLSQQTCASPALARLEHRLRKASERHPYSRGSQQVNVVVAALTEALLAGVEETDIEKILKQWYSRLTDDKLAASPVFSRPVGNMEIQQLIALAKDAAADSGKAWTAKLLLHPFTTGAVGCLHVMITLGVMIMAGVALVALYSRWRASGPISAAEQVIAYLSIAAVVSIGMAYFKLAGPIMYETFVRKKVSAR